MKEMSYSTEKKREILDTGFCFGLLYYIMNLGTHPTAYVKVPKESEFYEKKHVDIGVHGGITYSEKGLWISETEEVDGWFIGWDYAHYMDYIGYRELPIFKRMFSESDINEKKWTTQEIFSDVKEVCYQIAKSMEDKKVEEKNNV